MEKVKIKDINTGAIKEVKKSLAGDYVGTRQFVLLDEKEAKKEEKSFVSKKDEEK